MYEKCALAVQWNIRIGAQCGKVMDQGLKGLGFKSGTGHHQEP